MTERSLHQIGPAPASPTRVKEEPPSQTHVCMKRESASSLWGVKDELVSPPRNRSLHVGGHMKEEPVSPSASVASRTTRRRPRRVGVHATAYNFPAPPRAFLSFHTIPVAPLPFSRAPAAAARPIPIPIASPPPPPPLLPSPNPSSSPTSRRLASSPPVALAHPLPPSSLAPVPVLQRCPRRTSRATAAHPVLQRWSTGSAPAPASLLPLESWRDNQQRRPRRSTTSRGESPSILQEPDGCLLLCSRTRAASPGLGRGMRSGRPRHVQHHCPLDTSPAPAADPLLHGGAFVPGDARQQPTTGDIRFHGDVHALHA
ncbi:WAS/WASL-interacting protein family member 3 [Triticum aestivum]|uniref:WAS/WASL-interacting protein family member 3 n=1 Tax=Triticum aestivum TaxID=4565 RepID=UPI001D02BF64|nr:WAS/WASL-interacting protein family member 3-like [Triticum aestivum]